MLFMTPWRQSGIELAIKYMKKFDYFVPCYYDFQKDRVKISLEGQPENYTEHVKL